MIELEKAAHEFWYVGLPAIGDELNKVEKGAYPSPQLLAQKADIRRRYREGCAVLKRLEWAQGAESRAFRKKKFF